MNSARRITFAAAAFFFLHCSAHGASEVVIAIRYLQAEGVSHSHLFLYRDDGKFLRQLTNDDSGQDVDPVFSPEGEVIVFTRENEGNPLEFWTVHPLGGPAAKLDSAPDWYEHAKTSPYFTNRTETKSSESSAPKENVSPNASATPALVGMIGERRSYK